MFFNCSATTCRKHITISQFSHTFHTLLKKNMYSHGGGHLKNKNNNTGTARYSSVLHLDEISLISEKNA